MSINRVVRNIVHAGRGVVETASAAIRFGDETTSTPSSKKIAADSDTPANVPVEDPAPPVTTPPADNPAPPVEDPAPEQPTTEPTPATENADSPGGANHAMQTKTFSNGGSVVHRVRLSGSNSKFSVWYTANGDVDSVERIGPDGRSGAVGVKQMALIVRTKPGYVKPTATEGASATDEIATDEAAFETAMSALETAAGSSWFTQLGKAAQAAYIKRFPNSKFARRRAPKVRKGGVLPKSTADTQLATHLDTERAIVSRINAVLKKRSRARQGSPERTALDAEHKRLLAEQEKIVAAGDKLHARAKRK